MNITRYVSSKHSNKLGSLTLSSGAVDMLQGIADEHGFPDVESLHRAVAESTGSFVNSTYFSFSDWFRGKPLHSFRALEVSLSDGTTFQPVFVIDTRAGQLLTESEAALPDSYAVERLLAEVAVDDLVERRHRNPTAPFGA